MKKIVSFSVIILATLLLLPLTAVKTEVTAPTVQASAPLQPQADNNERFKILISGTGKIEEISAEDYLFGVVSAEMPALYEEEALKSQTICAYTFLKWRQKENADKDYDITDDYTTDQCYISEAEALAKWGSKADEYKAKIKNAISQVLGYTLTYNGDIILSVYHAVSGGATESAKNVWGKDYPYLQAVSSVGDKLANNYISTATVTTESFKSTLGGKTTLPDNLENCFSEFKRTSSGTVASVKIGNTEFKGSEIRELFDLKSSNFEVAFKDNSFTFTVYGYGHGVGMSQNGANEMAKQGSTYEEILKHYYTGCQIMRKS